MHIYLSKICIFYMYIVLQIKKSFILIDSAFSFFYFISSFYHVLHLKFPKCQVLKKLKPYAKMTN